MRRSTLMLLAVAALVLAACEIRTDYAMFVEGDSSAILALELSYDSEAAQLFGAAEAFLDEELEIEEIEEIPGVTVLSAEADSTDPDDQRVTATFGAEDGAAFDRLVDELFPGSSFTNTGGDSWALSLRPDEDVIEDFGEEFPLDDIGFDFISGEVRLDHDGSQVSMTGGQSGSGNEVIWDPYGPGSLEVVMDLSGATPPSEPEEPAEPEDAAEPEEPAEQEQSEEPTESEEDADTGEPEEADDGLAAADGDPAAAVGEDDDGLPWLLLAAIAAGVLLLLLILALVLRSRGKKKRAAAQAQQPVAAGVGAGAAGWEQSQQPTQQWDQGQAPAAPPASPQAPGGQPPASPQPPSSQPPASPQAPGGQPPASPQPPSSQPPASPQAPGGQPPASPQAPGGQPPASPQAPSSQPPPPSAPQPGQGGDDHPRPPQPPPPPAG